VGRERTKAVNDWMAPSRLPVSIPVKDTII